MATRELRSAPSILPLYARAAAPLLPGASLLPFVGGRGGEIPDLELTLAQVRVDPNRLAAYAHVCGLSLRETLPGTYPHVLAFPLHLALMADRSFPFGAVGLVHVANRIVLRRPIHVEEPLDLRVRATPLREHPRGRTFSLVSEARIGEELVWEEQSTMLRRGTGTGGGEPDRRAGSESRGTERANGESHDTGTLAGEPERGRPAPPPPGTEWRLPGDLGRRYAAVSGDRNPIHMHALSAKAFGFARAIAHGMWTKARCLAALEALLPDAYSVEVHFRRPIELPAKVAFGEVRRSAGIGFAVRDAKRDTPHLDGEVEPVAGAAREEGSGS
jgi:acyl dehydratase